MAMTRSQSGSEEEVKFSIPNTISLAGYAFEAYNSPVVGKAAVGADQTHIFYTSVDYLRTSFSGRLIVTLHRAKAFINEDQVVVEKILSGNQPDLYVQGIVYEDYFPPSSNRSNRIVDSARSMVVYNRDDAMWENQHYSIYVRDPNRTVLEVALFDKSIVSEDVFLGSAIFTLKEILDSQGEDGNGSLIEPLDIPLYRDREMRSPPNESVRMNRRKRERTGTVRASFTYQPFSTVSDEEIEQMMLATEIDQPKPPQQQQQQLAGANAGVTIDEDVDIVMDTDSGFDSSSMLRNLRDQVMQTMMDLPVDYKGIPRDLLSVLPRGASPGHAHWPTLLLSYLRRHRQFHHERKPGNLLSSLLSSPRLVQICQMDNRETDTQLSIWCDRQNRVLLLSFRGTETIRIKDILVDMKVVQAPFRDDHLLLRQAMVHAGFLEAYRSVQTSLLHEISDILESSDDPNDEWDIYITGHSLGGALATLCAFDLTRQAVGLYNDSAILYKQRSAPLDEKSSSTTSDGSEGNNNGGALSRMYDILRKGFAKAIASNSATIEEGNNNIVDLHNYDAGGKVYQYGHRHLHYECALLSSKNDPAMLFTESSDGYDLFQTLRRSHFYVYTYGSPRVGNSHFQELYNKLVPHTFRVVNMKDVVPRLPREMSIYKHVGRTVLLEQVNEMKADEPGGQQQQNQTKMLLLVERETSPLCPIEDLPLFLNATGSLDFQGIYEGMMANINPDLLPRNISDNVQQMYQQLTSAAAQNSRQALETLSQSILSNGLNASNALNNMTLRSIQDSFSSVLDQSEETMISLVNGSSHPSELSNQITQQLSSQYQSLVQNMSNFYITNMSFGLLDRFSSQYQRFVANMSQLYVSDLMPREMVERLQDFYSKAVNTTSQFYLRDQVPTWEKLGIRKAFIDREVELLATMLDMSALLHHLEPSYYSALAELVSASNSTQAAQLEAARNSSLLTE
eukprot:gene3837-4190_t